jgi:hypothetical protein
MLFQLHILHKVELEDKMVMKEVDLEICCQDLIQCSHYIHLVKVRENKINLIGFMLQLQCR